MSSSFGARRIYYNNFASHLLNAYNPNMLYPDLPNRWTDEDWRSCIDMIASFGYTVFEFWLVPRLFSPEGPESDFGREFIRQMNVICDHAHTKGIKVEYICSLATVGDSWHTYCPNDPDEWSELRALWHRWTKLLPNVDIIGIFPGDPGACSRNGCTALTFIDKACEIAELVRGNLPTVEVELHTWGPPFFGWGIIEGPPGWTGEFVQSRQHTAWRFSKKRSDQAMEHLIRRLPDFPDATAVAINLGFNPDGNPEGDEDARQWARQISASNSVHTWDFSLTEGENNVVPHYRFARLFAQRQRERESAPFSGGICFTMSPLLNQLSLWEGAQSFINPDADPDGMARKFYRRLFGPEGETIVPYLPLFEVVKDWGNYLEIDPQEPEYHKRIGELRDLLESLAGCTKSDLPFHPSPDSYRGELLYFSRLFSDLSGPSRDFDRLAADYWRRVYKIYDRLPGHVDPRPRAATRSLISAFSNDSNHSGPTLGKWE